MELSEIFKSLFFGVGIIAGAILWYLQARQASLEIEALRDSSEKKDLMIEEKNGLLEEQKRTIRVIESEDSTVVELSTRNRKYSFNIDNYDKTGESRVFDSENFEGLQELDDIEEIEFYVKEVKDYADEVKAKLSEYPSNKYL